MRIVITIADTVYDEYYTLITAGVGRYVERLRVTPDSPFLDGQPHSMNLIVADSDQRLRIIGMVCCERPNYFVFDIDRVQSLFKPTDYHLA